MLLLQLSRHAAERAEAIEALMWSPGQHRWNDLLLLSPPESVVCEEAVAAALECVQMDVVHACSWTPLLFGMPLPQGTGIDTVISTMGCCGLVRPGGLATTLVNSAEQWDGSNCWPPLVAMWVDGLKAVHEAHGSTDASKLADTLAKAFLSSVAEGLEHTGFVWEKYNADAVGGVGSGGEYDVQIGFGWSIGTVLHCLLNLRIDW